MAQASAATTGKSSADGLHTRKPDYPHYPSGRNSRSSSKAKVTNPIATTAALARAKVTNPIAVTAALARNTAMHASRQITNQSCADAFCSNCNTVSKTKTKKNPSKRP